MISISWALVQVALAIYATRLDIKVARLPSASGGLILALLDWFIIWSIFSD